MKSSESSDMLETCHLPVFVCCSIVCISEVSCRPGLAVRLDLNQATGFQILIMQLSLVKRLQLCFSCKHTVKIISSLPEKLAAELV